MLISGVGQLILLRSLSDDETRPLVHIRLLETLHHLAVQRVPRRRALDDCFLMPSLHRSGQILHVKRAFYFLQKWLLFYFAAPTIQNSADLHIQMDTHLPQDGFRVRRTLRF